MLYYRYTGVLRHDSQNHQRTPDVRRRYDGSTGFEFGLAEFAFTPGFSEYGYMHATFLDLIFYVRFPPEVIHDGDFSFVNLKPGTPDDPPVKCGCKKPQNR